MELGWSGGDEADARLGRERFGEGRGKGEGREEREGAETMQFVIDIVRKEQNAGSVRIRIGSIYEQ